MRSPTQRSLAVSDIQDILGEPVLDASELGGGGFAAVWRAALTGGREVVVKVGPPPAARLLAYEEGLIRREAEYFRLVAGRAPVPEVLAAADDWIVTTLLPGRPLTEADSPSARFELGAVVARIHEITGPHFGYVSDPAPTLPSGPAAGSDPGPGGRACGSDWPAVFTEIMASLRADAAAWGVPLPPLDGVVERHTEVLAEVTRRGYGRTRFDRSARVRLSLYRLHLYVLMLAEGPSRGIGRDRHDHVTRLLTAEIDHLAAL